MVEGRTVNAETENREAEEGLVSEEYSDDNDDDDSDSDTDTGSIQMTSIEIDQEGTYNKSMHCLPADEGHISPILSSEPSSQDQQQGMLPTSSTTTMDEESSRSPAEAESSRPKYTSIISASTRRALQQLDTNVPEPITTHENLERT